MQRRALHEGKGLMCRPSPAASELMSLATLKKISVKNPPLQGEGMGGDGVAFSSQIKRTDKPTPHRSFLALATATLLALLGPTLTHASGEPEKVERTYVTAPPAPAFQTWEQADAKSAGCVSCHTASDRKTMHASPAAVRFGRSASACLMPCTEISPTALGSPRGCTVSRPDAFPITKDIASMRPFVTPHRTARARGCRRGGGASSGAVSGGARWR